jgi:hypothetical protein
MQQLDCWIERAGVDGPHAQGHACLPKHAVHAVGSLNEHVPSAGRFCRVSGRGLMRAVEVEVGVAVSVGRNASRRIPPRYCRTSEGP